MKARKPVRRLVQYQGTIKWYLGPASLQCLNIKIGMGKNFGKYR